MMPVAVTRRLLVGAGGALTLAGCSRLGMLNGVNELTPGDRDVERLAAGVAFGPEARQTLDVYAPKGAARAPVLLFFYGGSWSSGRRQDYAFAARAYAARGFVTVVPDYRLVPQVHYPAFIEDGAAALGWTVANIARFGGDPAAIGVAGHSAGAWIALMLALDGRWAAAAGAPPGAIRAAVGLAGPYDVLPFAPGGAADLAMGRAPDLAATQPISHASAAAPPVLLLTGDADSTVKPRNSLALASALVAAGAAAEARIYPGIGHVGILLALSKPFRGRAPALADSAGFLKAQLG
jgi:acetyl esterase/lipase